MDRFAKVSPHLYRGSKPSKNDLFILKNKYNVSRIVSLDGDVASEIHPICNLFGLEHLVIPIDGSFPSETYKLSNNILEIFPNNKISFVHCYYGKDRSSMACAMYRIANGADVGDALAEAYRFGMGAGLSPKVKKMYYDAILNFSKKDSNSADVVEMSRDQTAMDNMAPGISNYQDPTASQMSFAPFSDAKRESASPVMNVSASKSVYVLSTPTQVMAPQQWFSREAIMSQLPGKQGQKLYIADIDSRANIINYHRRYNRTLLQSAKLDGGDVVFFVPDIVFILNPSALINIREEHMGDSNQAGDFPIVGYRGNYDGLAPYVMPGSGGVMPPGYGGDGGSGSYGDSSSGVGAAGPVQLPLIEF